MKRFRPALVYTGLALLAILALLYVVLPQNAPVPEPEQTAQSAPAPTSATAPDSVAPSEGGMKKMNFHADPKATGSSEFTTFDGAPLTLAEYRGKWVLVNFWATWCAPCREEMPTLSELQSELGGDDFEVVTIATGRNPPGGMTKFFDEIGVSNLPLHRDPKSALAREMSVLGLPITVIINPEGQEIGRLQGDADWSSETAVTMLRELIGGA